MGPLWFFEVLHRPRHGSPMRPMYNFWEVTVDVETIWVNLEGQKNNKNLITIYL